MGLGLGLDEFLGHGQGGGKRKFLEKWKDKPGYAVVWLSTRAQIAYPSWTHPFTIRITKKVQDKESGEVIEKPALQFVRFVSPDAEIVHNSQYFRDKATDRLQVPPALDPFLLLREWLRHECQEPLDAVVFSWTNPETKEVTEWKRGHLARLTEKKTMKERYASLDTKLEYLFVVVDDAHPEKGPQLTRETKLLGDKMKKTIGSEVESNGDEGNPLIHPYAFRWTFDKDARSPMDTYDARRFNRAKLTDAIREAIMDPNFPDPAPDCRPRPGDKARIRAAMEDAAQIDIPFDRFFVPEWKDDVAPGTDFPFGENAPKEPAAGNGRTPEVRTSTPATTPTGEVGRRRKKAPEKPPEPERIKCDDCPNMLLPTDRKCSQCGAEYEVEAETTPAQKPTTTTPAQAAPAASGGSAEKCWSCGNAAVVGDRCTACGIDVSDDLPYG